MLLNSAKQYTVLGPWLIEKVKAQGITWKEAQ